MIWSSARTSVGLNIFGWSVLGVLWGTWVAVWIYSVDSRNLYSTLSLFCCWSNLLWCLGIDYHLIQLGVKVEFLKIILISHIAMSKSFKSRKHAHARKCIG